MGDMPFLDWQDIRWPDFIFFAVARARTGRALRAWFAWAAARPAPALA
jgi:hypothetical protein